MKPDGKGLLVAVGMGPKKKAPLFGKSNAEPPSSSHDETDESSPEMAGDREDHEDVAGDDFLDAMESGDRESAKEALKRYVQACVQKALDGGYDGDDEEEPPTSEQ